MIMAIGIDSIEVKRFEQWHSKPLTQLKKLFSEEEINYCLKNKLLSAQRFAVRFAAREALFKALCSAKLIATMPFLTVCKAVCVVHGVNNAPILSINWALLKVSQQIDQKEIKAHLSLTHSSSIATACVILERI